MKSIFNALMTVFLLLSATLAYSQQNNLEKVYQSYFNLKDALIASDEKVVSEKAHLFSTELEKVKMESLDHETHMIWMKTLKNLNQQTETISQSNDIEKQRKSFASLSESIHSLMKTSKPDEAVYYQTCPMYKANWVSKEKEIKNPYYGEKMLSCGSIKETIQ